MPLVVSFAATLDSKGRKRKLLSLHDISVAFYHAAIDEDIYVVPPKGEEEEGWVWQLLRAMYGTRRASFLFQKLVIQVLTGAEFVRIIVATQLFWHATREILTSVHGDDFLSGGEPESLDWLDHLLEKNFVVKAAPRVGPPELGGTTTGDYLKRTIHWYPRRVQLGTRSTARAEAGGELRKGWQDKDKRQADVAWQQARRQERARSRGRARP